MYKVRVILDTEQDVIRTLLIDENQSLEKLHFAIASAFGFEGEEMASFYIADNEWNQGEEIPLFSMAEVGVGVSMATSFLNTTLPKVNDKLIYVYDFLHMWTFYVEVIEQSNERISEVKTILSVGEIPDEVPEKKFESENLNNLSDDFNDGFDDLERFDDLDFDNY